MYSHAVFYIVYMNSMTKVEALDISNEHKLCIELDHVRQRYSWDCGIACVMMVLPAAVRDEFNTKFSDICEEQGFDKSTWTIDLAYLLHQFGIKLKYCTVTLGVDPGYAKEKFYTNVLCKDYRRVTKRFSSAAGAGVQVNLASVPVDDIIKHLKEEGPVIVLINAHLLLCAHRSCRLPCLLHPSACLPCTLPYQGHYIVVVGFDSSAKRILYRNPDLSDRICSTSFSNFNKARQSYGTDEDIIFIFSSPSIKYL